MNSYSNLVSEYASAQTFHSAVPLANQQFMAVVCLLLAVVFVFLNFLIPKTSSTLASSIANNAQYIVYSFLASGLFGIGAIFLSNSVGVYA
ncbi:hypothetical protein DASC09_006980 [Saccharomycopsis crataegensis]|uniref:Dolichyl-diphosphooligosaccharide-protein glycosyltransferase subunit OST5 n=1 Tax=Saccharomycopsis crataegensis TaxID=43959 RepID=A0AAV5QGR6_9ASCO|nr:hypothetical protein DASC09_006980 [Saccharomycopsis crataegensis]